MTKEFQQQTANFNDYHAAPGGGGGALGPHFGRYVPRQSEKLWGSGAARA